MSDRQEIQSKKSLMNTFWVDGTMFEFENLQKIKQ
jgi:hypothetical protein